MEGSVPYTILSGLKYVVPAVAATAAANRITCGPVVSAKDHKKNTPYGAKGLFITKPDVTMMKPKYHKVAYPGQLFGGLKYEPHQLAVRTEYDGEKWHTFNNLAGSVNSVFVYDDNRKAYEMLTKGDSIPAWQGKLGENMGGGMLKHAKGQITAGRVLAGLRMSCCEIDMFKNFYKIPEENIAMLGSRRFVKYMYDKHPGSALDKTVAYGYSGVMKVVANTTVIIRPTAAKKKDNGEEHQPTDSGWTLSFESTDRSKYKIANPVRGINTPEDTLTEHFHIVNNWRVSPTGMNSVNNSTSRTLRTAFSSMQEAIVYLDMLGFNWYVESDRSNAFPVSRHKLYANNFPYRGCTKKRLHEKGAKRQKGGDASRVVEWDPSLENHFEGKTKEDVFYA
eukprot:TRINITY_DN38036_c0_g1_i1.p1 TRINITY_DN38036_c0_g1~~TRINITY_DN38036_c0_g1_i1.p1  ORF type:complete len:393 (+),score=96.33 TRINITY_DN38036_c0_g1_i1:54-1232(+)